MFKTDTPKVDFPTFSEDCKFINVCKYINEDCFKGAPAFINHRCSKERINQMLDNKELQPQQNINIEGSSNVQVNQQGNNSHNQQEQGISLDEIPQELLDDFKELISLPAKDNRTKWITFLNKFNTIGGSVVTLTRLINLLTSG